MRLHLERALLPGGVASDVVVEVVGGRFASVEVAPAGTPAGTTAGTAATERLPGLTLPGLANTHSHAFHRALRGHVQRQRGSFWTWREQMYGTAGQLDPDSYFALARATYREMVAAGWTGVAEFHYVHHAPDGRRYAPVTAMADAVVAAAAEAGVRLTLLPTMYASSGFGKPAEPEQQRFLHDSVEQLVALAAGVASGPGVTVGLAAHSVRAVLPGQLAALAAAADGGPLHVHLSEQRAENDACLAAHGVTPTRLLADSGLLGPATTVVHATHLTEKDVALLGAGRVTISMCPTTERDLGDGIGPARRLQEAGCRITVGSDSQAVIDPFEELRALELDERLGAQARGHWTAEELLAMGSDHRPLGVSDAGAIEVGRRADLVTVDTGSVRTAGTGAGPETAVFAATGADVTHVVVDGRVVFRRGDEQAIGRELAEAVAGVRP